MKTLFLILCSGNYFNFMLEKSETLQRKPGIIGKTLCKNNAFRQKVRGLIIKKTTKSGTIWNNIKNLKFSKKGQVLTSPKLCFALIIICFFCK